METRKQKKETVQPANPTDLDPFPSAPSDKLTMSNAANTASMETTGGNMIMKAITDMRGIFGELCRGPDGHTRY